MRRLFSLLAVAWIWGSYAAVPVIYLEQSHTGSFTFFTETTDRTRDYRLLLVDAHPDSNAATNSDAIRDGVLSISNLRQRARRLDQWRKEGRIQCYNWLEPLMPRPVASVYWMPAKELLQNQTPDELTQDAVAYLDGRLEIDPRECGSLSKRWKTISRWEELPNDQGLPWLASIDLDAFANAFHPEEALEECWKQVTGLYNLCAISICLSRPWHKDDATAWRLWEKAIRLSLQTHPAHVLLNGCPLPEKDTSRMATSFKKQGKSIPQLDWKQAPDSLWALLTAHRSRFSSARPDVTWENILESHKKTVPKVGLTDIQASLDGTWRMDAGQRHHLEAGDIYDLPVIPRRYRWYRLTPVASIANLKPEDSKGASFTGHAGNCILWKEQFVAETEDPFLDNDTWRRGITLGRSWWKVAILAGSQVWESLPATIAITEGEGFHSALSEQFGTPYMYGVGSIPYMGQWIAGTGLGNDCANMICYAWRRNGHRIPWSSPRELTRYMRLLGNLQTEDTRIPFTPEEQSTGLVVDAVNHSAALWQDKPPLGSLGQEDLVIHHLSGQPEILTLADFRKRYKRFSHSVWTLGDTEPGVSIALLGDVVAIGEDTLWDRLCHSLQDYNLVMANVEGSIACSREDVPQGRKYTFLSTPERQVALLKQAGVRVASLANNHSEDGGPQSLLQNIRYLNNAGIQTVGAGTTVKEALSPAIVRIGERTIAVWGAAHDEALNPPVSPTIHLARLPQDQAALLESVLSWKNRTDMNIIMIHWGRENTDKYTPAQTECTRRLAAAGFDIIAGSHPHILLSPETLGTTLVFPSLGNARMPNSVPTPAFNKRGWGFISTGNTNIRRELGIKNLKNLPSTEQRKKHSCKIDKESVDSRK